MGNKSEQCKRFPCTVLFVYFYKPEITSKDSVSLDNGDGEDEEIKENLKWSLK